MSEQRSLLSHVGEAIDRYRAEREGHTKESQSDRLYRRGRLWHWFIPNGGTLLLVIALVLTANVWARPLVATQSTPGPSATTVNYQGRLADNAGTPLDGAYGMSFALYDAASAGNLVWGPEDHPAVPVSDGLFSVGLGSRTTGGIPTTTWNGDRYLKIAVGGETLEPRELIRSVPIAGMALTVPDGAITQAKLGDDISLEPPDGSITAEKLADASVRNEQLVQRGLNPSPDHTVRGLPA